MDRILLLGPQRRLPMVAEAVSRLGLQQRVAAITAGWQERADEIAELERDLDVEVLRLDLYRRAEQIFESAPDFFAAYRERQNALRTRQQIYRKRLELLMRQCLTTWELPETYSHRRQEFEHSLGMVRELDRYHIEVIDSIQAEFDACWTPLQRPEIQEHRQEIRESFAECQGVLIAGGQVAVLLNRLRLFGIEDLLRTLPIVAWAGGAMVLADRLILFHDDPPQGERFPEILDRGLGLYSSVLCFPDASRRLQLNNQGRMEILARRFAPQRCLLLDPGTSVFRENGKWVHQCPHITKDGSVTQAPLASKNPGNNS